MAAHACGGTRGMLDGCRRRAREALVGPPPARAQHEVVGLDGQRFLEPELIVVRIAEGEIAQHQRQCQLGFGQRELAPDAGALATAERHIRMRRQPGLVLGQEAVDIEALGMGPHLGVAMQRRQHDGDTPVLRQEIAAADHGVFVGRDRKGRCGGPQAQRFLEHALKHGQTREVRIDRLRVARQDRIDFRIRLRQHARAAQQLVQREGQQAAGGFMARDQERDDLVADIGIVEARIGFRVARVQHQVQQVRTRRGRGAPLADDVVDHVAHIVDVGRKLPVRRAREPAVLDAHARELAHGFAEGAGHRHNKWVEPLARERIEVVAKAGQRNGVERQARHVVGHGDVRIGTRAMPLVDQAIGDAQHHIEVALHRALAERGHQDAVRAAPVGFVAVRGKQPIAGHIAQVGQRRSDEFAKALAIAQFGRKCHRADERHTPARKVELEDAVVMAAAREQVLAHRTGRDLQQVTDDRQAGVARDGLELRGGGSDGGVAGGRVSGRTCGHVGIGPDGCERAYARYGHAPHGKASRRRAEAPVDNRLLCGQSQRL